MRRKAAAAFAAIALACAAWSSACATSNGDATEEDPGASSSSSTSSSSSSGSSSGSDRPAFDASFPEEQPDANVDPTPEAGADTCIDNDDPGGAENVAKTLPATDDCDDKLKSVKGVMNGAVDVDFYKVSVSDDSCGLLQPDIGATTAGIELCAFVRCKNPTPDAVSGCKQGVMQTNAATGMKGCCANGPGKAVPDWNCSGLDDSADLLIRVKPSGSSDACIAYTFTYVF